MKTDKITGSYYRGLFAITILIPSFRIPRARLRLFVETKLSNHQSCTTPRSSPSLELDPLTFSALRVAHRPRIQKLSDLLELPIRLCL